MKFGTEGTFGGTVTHKVKGMKNDNLIYIHISCMKYLIIIMVNMSNAECGIDGVAAY